MKNILLIGSEGYVGAFLASRLLNEEGVALTELDLRAGPRNVPLNYQDLFEAESIPLDILRGQDIVLWFAGHSSVAAAVADPEGALQNNCLGVVKLRRLMRPDALLVYASSASVYSSSIVRPPWSLEDASIAPPANAYDASKYAVDYLMTSFFHNAIGLRMGTVSGRSPNMRRELVFNAMNIAAVNNSVVSIFNPGAWRSILFLDDLWGVVQAAVHLKPSYRADFAARKAFVMNVASSAYNIGDLGRLIAIVHDAKCRVGDSPSGSTYSFRMNTILMRDFVGKWPGSNFMDQCKAFR
jgi:nucleoside-diphosphate-sugar epimerase